MRWTQLIFASGGMLTGLSGWAGDAAISRPVDAPQGPDFHLKYEKYSFFGVRSEEIAFELEKIRFGSADVEIMPFVIKALPDANSRNYSLPVGVPGTQNPPKKLILPLSKSGSSLAAMGLRKRAYSTGGMQAGFCSSTPDFKIQSMSTGATALAGPGSTLKIPLPVHNPIDGAFVINPREAAKRLGDDMAEGLAWFLRQALPGIEEADFHTTAERTQLAIHYRSTYGQMEPVRKPNRPVRYVGIGHAGSIGDTFRQMRSMGAESLSESEKGEGAIGGHIEDSNFFTHMRNTRRFLGRQENNRDFLMDYRETLYEHGRYSIPAQQLQMQQFEVLVQELLEIVQTVTAANPHLNVDFSSIQYEQLLHVEGSGIITVNAVPPEWINYFIQALLYDWYKSFNSITNQDQLLEVLFRLCCMIGIKVLIQLRIRINYWIKWPSLVPCSCS